MEKMRYWLTPSELEKYKVGRFDPFPFPKPADWDALSSSWSKPWYANPPFEAFTKYARKAIKEGDGYLVGPCPVAICELLRSGAQFLEAGRYAWLECDTRAPMPNPGWSAVWYCPTSPVKTI